MNERELKLNMLMLEKSVRAAALPAERQVTLYPAGYDAPFEVADDFSNWCRWVLEAEGVILSDDQRSSLRALDDYLDSISGEKNAAIWTEEALRAGLEWEEVRRRARKILDLFGWLLNQTTADIGKNE